jgi:hypothetical protein
VTKSAHPARFSPDDKFSRHRVTIKKRSVVIFLSHCHEFLFSLSPFENPDSVSSSPSNQLNRSKCVGVNNEIVVGALDFGSAREIRAG